jgi:two-component system phosphate regulon sensor histidine kinase PhoR
VGGRIDREKHKLIFDFPEEAVSVEADDLRIRQVVINLLGNAIKFTKQGTITVWLREDGEHVVFGVRDTGIGIAKEKLPLLFRRFEQVHERKAMTEAGTGLGLALCRQIIEAHHGSIHVESELGEGSNFYCRLPRHRPQNGDGSDG